MWDYFRMDFIEYIDGMLAKKQWTRNELLTRAGLSSSYLTMVAKGARKPGADACRKIAAALGVTESQVFRFANVTTERPTLSPLDELLISLTGKLTDAEKEEFIDLARVKLERRERVQGNNK